MADSAEFCNRNMPEGDSIAHFGGAPDGSHGASLPNTRYDPRRRLQETRMHTSSEIRNHFTVQEKHPDRANCNHCGSELGKSSRSGIRALFSHMQSCQKNPSKLGGKQSELRYQVSADVNSVVSGSTWQYNEKEMDTEEAGRKRERLAETDGAGKRQAWTKKPSGKISAASQAASFYRRARESSLKRAEELRLKRAVARRNEENLAREPIVAEELTEQDRAELLQEEKAREMTAQRELSEWMYAELLAAEAEMAQAPPPLPDLNLEDRSELDYSEYHRNWNDKWSSQYGSFEDTTPIPCMRFTDNPVPHLTCHPSTVQIFSVKVAEIAGGLQCPLDVFGTIAMRDGLDHNRNIIFCRTRDNCQSLTQQDRNLVLTGPVRAVVHEYGSVYIDAVLKVKGSTESEDKDLSLLIMRCNCYEPLKSFVSSRSYNSKLSTLELAYGIIVSSVEATIAVRVIEGSWPDGFRSQFTASTATLPHMEVLLLDSGKEKVTAADGMVELSRCVVSVERLGQLIVSALLFRGGDKVAEAKTIFEPLEAGRSQGELDVGLCKMQVTVAWSPFLKGYPIRGFVPAKE